MITLSFAFMAMSVCCVSVLLAQIQFVILALACVFCHGCSVVPFQLLCFDCGLVLKPQVSGVVYFGNSSKKRSSWVKDV